MDIPTHCGLLLACALLLIATGATVASGKPYIPADDSAVLERLPEGTDPSLAALKRLRATLAANPRDLRIAEQVARRSIEAARTTGDPRFLGQAQAALAPWWHAADAPATALVLRATVKQSQHDFNGALADLDRVLALRPADAQALLTRATIHAVQGRHAQARSDCGKLARVASNLVTMTCLAGVTSLDGDAAGAYAGLTRALARSGDDAATRVWALTLAAEIATRRGDADAATVHFRDALALDPRDGYLLAAYADYLLDAGRAREVLMLLADEGRNDNLLLRLALAEQVLPDRQAQFDVHRRQLAERFAAAQRRGDTVHLREEARFRLAVDGDARAALALAQANWTVQREPADLYLLAAAGRAAGDAVALRTAAAWLQSTRLEYPLVAALITGGSAR
jgi:tetratricopeptide (TPR) repeat protein